MPVDRPAVDPKLPAGLLDGAPPYRRLDLPGRGSLVVRDSGPSPDRPDAPVVILLHRWWVDADLNWCRTYAALSDRHRVVALDHRGHGSHGLRTRRRFRLEDCADDELAEGLAAHVEEVDGDHLACVTAADHFVPALERALAAVAAS